MSSLISSDEVKMGCKNIDDLALAFVAPLSAHYHNVFHVNLSTTRILGLPGELYWKPAEPRRVAAKTNLRRTLRAAMCACCYRNLASAPGLRSASENAIDHTGDVVFRGVTDHPI